MPVERLGNGLLEIRSRHRLLRQTFQQNLTLVQKTGGAIAALERKVLNESLLQNRKLAVLRMTFDRADGLAVEVHRRNYAGRHGMAFFLGVISQHFANQGTRGAAA